MKQLKTVAKFSDPMRASIAKGMLESNGIEAEVFGEVSSYPSINAAEQNIKLKVNEADYESALSLLAASDKAQ
ncbi:MAG: DUF2007 domain-containing protein [Bacteroidales bacterium]|jgi:hypothetical protein|nr:DUF2007 domain-containing protein [Bacteroidales bacterium]